MFSKILLSLLIFITTTFAETELCVQGCCDLASDFNVAQLKFFPESGNQVFQKFLTSGHQAIQCCPCPEKSQSQNSSERGHVAMDNFGPKTMKNKTGSQKAQGGECGLGVCNEFCDCTDDNKRQILLSQVQSDSDQVIMGECAPGVCEPEVCFCNDERHGLRQPNWTHELRRVCPLGQCNPAECLCREEIYLAVRESLFGPKKGSEQHERPKEAIDFDSVGVGAKIATTLPLTGKDEL